MDPITKVNCLGTFPKGVLSFTVERTVILSPTHAPKLSLKFDPIET